MTQQEKGKKSWNLQDTGNWIETELCLHFGKICMISYKKYKYLSKIEVASHVQTDYADTSNCDTL